MKNILLLTSTIKPKTDQPELAIADPEERLKDYWNALEFYAAQLDAGVIDRIVYIDNSGYNLNCLSEQFTSDRIEWISFYDLDYPRDYHRGYGEFRLVDTAFSRSKTLAEIGESDILWKVTGRYIVKNLAIVIKYAPKQLDLYCLIKKKIWAEMSLMAWSRCGYDMIIKGIWEQFSTRKIPELILAEKLNSFDRSQCRIITTYHWPPFIIGRRGANAVPYQGRFTPIKFALTVIGKLAMLPFRRYNNGKFRYTNPSHAK